MSARESFDVENDPAPPNHPDPAALLGQRELRDAEERMRSVVDHVLEGIVTIDERARIESFNPAAERLFGYTRDEAVGQNVKLLMPEPYHSENDQYVLQYLRSSRARLIGSGREVVGRHKDGSSFPMELAVSEFHVGERRYFTGIVRDITERKRLERELRKRIEALDEADRQKDEFLAMLAHELRNPLAPMRNALHLLKMPDAEPPVAQHARAIMDRQLSHLVRLVDDLLDVSRIVRGKVELRRELTDLRTIVQRAVETAQPALDAHGHRLQAQLPDEPVWVHADVVRLAQAIANLLTNAAKYTGPAGNVSLLAGVQDDHAVVTVRDTGVGIPPDMLPRVFDLFVQGDRSLERSQGGLGIGLTLVERLVELHEGRVSAYSAGPGQGSEFTVRLPLAPGPGRHEAVRRRETAERDPGEQPRRVLVVDDNVDACESIALILGLGGYDAKCVHDGPSVLQTALDWRPHAIVLDIGLPGMSGYEVARQLRARAEFQGVLLLAMTGYGQQADRNRAQDAGFDRHLTKPVDPQQLQDMLAEGLARG
jgi:PAS domain S-box-containing protein